MKPGDTVDVNDFEARFMNQHRPMARVEKVQGANVLVRPIDKTKPKIWTHKKWVSVLFPVGQ